MQDGTDITRITPEIAASATGLRRRLDMNKVPLSRYFAAERATRDLEPLYEIFWLATALGAEGESILRLEAASLRKPLGGKTLAQILLRMMLRPRTPGQRLMCDEWASLLEIALNGGTPPAEFVEKHTNEHLRLCLKYVRNWRRWGVLVTTLTPDSNNEEKPR